MKFIICDNSWQKKWDEFIKNNSLDFGVLQSFAWGEFQEKIGKKILRVVIVDDQENILLLAQVEKRKLCLGKYYFYMPRGPVGIISNFQFLISNDGVNFLFNEIKELAQKENVIYLRIEPAWENTAENINLLKQLNFKPVGQVQPKQTLVLDLTQSEDELLAKMKSKTRYNIKVAQKHGIIIDEGQKYFADFWRLMAGTSKRDQFISHDKNYYQAMLQNLEPTGIMKLVVAKDGDKVIVANIMAYFGEWAVYLHGASDYEYRSKMAPYLLQWQSITQAKKQGFKYYDFWGVDEAKWPGVTRFKQGFDEQKKFTSYVGAWDEVYDKFWYNIYSIIKKIL